MRQFTRKGLITVAAAGGVLALGGGYAQADAGAHGGASNSPGVASGNSVQVPVHIPVNACGNTINVVALLNPAFGNHCSNVSGNESDDGGYGGGGSDDGGYGGGSGSDGGGYGGGSDSDGGGYGGGSDSGGGAHAGGGTSDSPGVGSGNNIQAPVDVPVNACGNSITIGGLLNPTFGNDCDNNGGGHTPPGHPDEPGNPGHPDEPKNPSHPSTPHVPNAPGAHSVTPPKGTEQLAQTGSGPLGMLVPAGAGLLLAGAVLFRRARASA
ncbi:chaplin [Streptomyces sp. NPDC005408]|uniref:chaplin n=1 Tax=Streptomyces sp. NPDC005408 TaxID=3155341 RepID=UPI00339E7BDF